MVRINFDIISFYKPSPILKDLRWFFCCSCISFKDRKVLVKSFKSYYVKICKVRVVLCCDVNIEWISNILSSHCVSLLDFRGVNINICKVNCCCVTIFDLNIWWEQLIMRTILHLWWTYLNIDCCCLIYRKNLDILYC